MHEDGMKSGSLEKGEAYVFEEDAQDKDRVPSPSEEDIYQFLLSYQQNNAGRLVLDPKSAPAEFGDEMARRLKLSPDGTKILWPQPRDDPDDPLNWSNRRKTVQLIVVTLAVIIPDFDASIGIAAVFAMAKDYHTTPNTLNKIAASWGIFLIGWGGIPAVMLIRRYGRLPVLFWSQLFALATLLGVTFAPNLATSAAMRWLGGFLGTCSQVSGLYVVTDMYPLHLQARKMSVWTMGFVMSPVLAPFLFGFMVARVNWRWSFGVGSFIGALVVLLVALFMEETMYDRRLRDPNPLHHKRSSVQYRVETLVGITGARMASYRDSWKEIVSAPFRVVWRPHLFLVLLFEGVIFGFLIGFHVTNTVLLALPPPNGYGYGQIQIAATYASSIVAVFLGEVLGRYLVDWLLEVAVRRNKGVFEPESRLWTCYIAVALWVCGFVLQGAAFQRHFPIAVLVVGWICGQTAAMMNTFAIYAYCNDCFPKNRGEISGLLNLARSLGGWSVTYFQVDWVTKHGALQAFGAEAGIVAGLFVLIIPVLQYKGRYLRSRFST